MTKKEILKQLKDIISQEKKDKKAKKTAKLSSVNGGEVIAEEKG